MALKDEQGRSQTSSQLYLTFTFTDTIYGSMTFYVGASGFNAGSNRVYPAIVDIGTLRRYLYSSGASEVTIQLYAAAEIVTGTTRHKIIDLYRRTDLRDVKVQVYQWHEDSATQEEVWAGYLGGVVDYELQNGTLVLHVIARQNPKSQIVAYAPVVNKTDHPNAQPESIGLMFPRCYGNRRQWIDTAATSTSPGSEGFNLHPGLLGYPVPGVLAIPYNVQAVSNVKVTTFMLSDMDGTSGPFRVDSSHTLTSASTNYSAATGMVGDFWLYLPQIESYGVPHIRYNYSGTSADVTVGIGNAPVTYVVVRPRTTNSQNNTGGTDDYKVIDDDPTNYIDLNAATERLSFDMPDISSIGGLVTEVYLCLDAEESTASSVTFDLGIYDANTAAYIGAHKLTYSLSSVRGRIQFSTASSTFSDPYVVADAPQPVEWQRGRFITTDGSSNDTPLHIRLAWSAGGTLRVYGISALVKMTMPQISGGYVKELRYITDPRPKFPGTKDPFGIQGPLDPFPYEAKVETFLDPDSLAIQVITTFESQKDDGSNTYTGIAAPSLIKKAPDIVHHILGKIGGFTCNTSTGTLGNFTDMRTEAVTGEKILAPEFVASEIDCIGAATVIAQRWPMRVWERSGTWYAVGDDMNPHSSRLYRSSSDIVRISAKRHIIEGSMRVEEDDVRGVVNNVALNYGHGYGTSRPGGTVEYTHPLSSQVFGTSSLETFDESWVILDDLGTGDPPNGTYLAQWYGTRQARPRLRVVVGLTQAFYDLKEGHVVEFDTDMEDVGLECPAFRCGILDYLFDASSDALAANQAHDTTPDLLAGGSVDRECYIGASQQFGEITFNVAIAGAYTAAASPWEYYDGSSWTALTGVVASDARAVNQAFASTGEFTLSFTRPTPTSWKKATRTQSSDDCGPVYWVRHKGTTVTTAATGAALVTYPAKWYGRLFEVEEISRKESPDRGPYIEAVLREVM